MRVGHLQQLRPPASTKDQGTNTEFPFVKAFSDFSSYCNNDCTSLYNLVNDLSTRHFNSGRVINHTVIAQVMQDKKIKLSYTTLQLENKQVKILVDSGSSVSLLKFTTAKKLGLPISRLRNRLSFVAVNDTPIRIKGLMHLNVMIHHRQCPFTFVVADVANNILGYDFLQHYEMKICYEQSETSLTFIGTQPHRSHFEEIMEIPQETLPQLYVTIAEQLI